MELFSSVKKVLAGWRSYLLDMKKKRERPSTLFKVGGIESVYTGSLSLVGGERKQGKSQTLIILTSVFLSGKPFGPVQRGDAPDGWVLWVDTEQNDWFQSRNVRRLYHLCGWPEDTPTEDVRLYYLGLFGEPPNRQLQLIKEALAEVKPVLLIIDQIGDLAFDTNDNAESAQLLTDLLDQTRQSPDTAIITVLHDNYNTTKARGHLGSYLEQKCAEKWIPKKGEDKTFTVTSLFSRGADLEPWKFRFSDTGDLVPDEEAEDDMPLLLERFKCEDVFGAPATNFTTAVVNLCKVMHVSDNPNSSGRREIRVWLDQKVSEWEQQGLVERSGKFVLKKK